LNSTQELMMMMMMIIIIIIIVIVIIIRHFSVQFITKCAVLDGFMQLQN